MLKERVLHDTDAFLAEFVDAKDIGADVATAEELVELDASMRDMEEHLGEWEEYMSFVQVSRAAGPSRSAAE